MAKSRNMGKIIRNAVLFSIIVAVIVEAYILNESRKGENYTVFYLLPDSYSNYLEGDTLNFTYNIESHGRASTSYRLRIFVGDQLVTENEMRRAGKNDVVLHLPEAMRFPTKVRLVLNSDYGENEVHFWIKGRIGE